MGPQRGLTIRGDAQVYQDQLHVSARFVSEYEAETRWSSRFRVRLELVRAFRAQHAEA
jgi:hypothetical protein